jgi:hypothetical protein
MSRDEKVAYLKSRGWRRIVGNCWQSSNGLVASFGNACQFQALADLEGSP